MKKIFANPMWSQRTKLKDILLIFCSEFYDFPCQDKRVTTTVYMHDEIVANLAVFHKNKKKKNR